METNLQTLGKLERRLTVALPTQDIDREVQERLKKLSRTVRMHGFRPGKVPLKLVQQQYGSQVRSEVVGDAVQKAFDEAVQENKLRVAGYPRVEPGEGGDGSHLSFSATFEVYPEFKLGDIGAKRIERMSLTIGDAEVDKTIEILRKQRSTYSAVERPAKSADRVTVDFTGRVGGAEFPGGKGKDVSLLLGEGRMLPDFERHLLQASGGEVCSFELKLPENYAAKEVAGKTATFEVTLTKVEEPKLPALDAEFAKSLGVADGDIAKMRDEVKANVEREVKKRIEADLRQKAMQALLDSTPVELPKALVELEVRRLVHAARADLESRGIKMEKVPINPEVFEAQAKRRVSLGLILGELVKTHDLSAKPEQVRALVEDYAQTYEQPGEMVRWLYSEPRRIGEFEGLVLEANVVKWVLEHARVEDKAVSFDDLMGKATA